MDVPWPLWVAAVVLIIVLVDRMVARRPDRPRPVRRPARYGSGGGPLGELLTVFAPSLRHLQEEVEAKKHDLVQPGDADPGWDLDLDAGTVRVPTSPGDGRPRFVEVAPGVWTATAVRWQSTTTVVVAPDGSCLVVDPGISADEVTALAAEISARGWAPATGFSTHPHWDHLLWHRDLGDVPRYATVDGAASAAARQASIVAQVDAEAPGHDRTLTARVVAVPDGATAIPWDGPTALVVPYPAHCAGSAALVLPDSGVLVAGDMLSDVEIPLLDLTSSDPVGDYRASLDVLEALADQHDVEVLVPGHGTVGDRTELARRLAADRRYLVALQGTGDVTDPRLVAGEQREQHIAQLASIRGT